MSIRSYALLGVALTLGVLSCKKDPTATGGSTTPITWRSLEDAFSEQSVVATTGNVDATNGGFFFGPRGSRFIFPAGAFQTPTGRPVTGTVQVAVREVVLPSDMIFSRVLPVSGLSGGPQLTGGMVWAFATQAGSTVVLKPGTQYTVNVPQPYGAQALPLYGYHEGYGLDSPGALGQYAWVPNAGGSVSAFLDTASITADTLGWIGAQVDYGAIDVDTYSVRLAGVQVPSTRGAGGPAVYAMYQNANTVVNIADFVGAQKSDIIGPEVTTHLVAMTVVNGEFWGGITTVADTKSGDTYTVNLQKTSPAEFKKRIDAL